MAILVHGNALPSIPPSTYVVSFHLYLCYLGQTARSVQRQRAHVPVQSRGGDTVGDARPQTVRAAQRKQGQRVLRHALGVGQRQHAKRIDGGPGGHHSALNGVGTYG